MAFDDHIRQALDRALAGARTHLESDMRALAQDIVRAAADERAKAVAQAAETAAADVRLRGFFGLAIELPVGRPIGIAEHLDLGLEGDAGLLEDAAATRRECRSRSP